MEEIQVGEYVRTDTGNLFSYEGKVKKYVDSHLSLSNKKDIEFLGTIVKHSKNIIDLIEEGDIIKKDLIVYKGKVANGTEKLLVGNHIIRGMALEVVDIKTIATKEQLESVEYRTKEVTKNEST